MRRALIVAVVLVPLSASAAPWHDRTAETIGATGEWSNKVELADLDGDGDVDIVFANGGNYNSPGTEEPNRVFLNPGDGGMWTEVTEDIFGAGGDLARVIKARDVDGDGTIDLFVGTTYSTQSRLFLGDGRGGFTEVTDGNLPQQADSIGDVEFGDIDDDGDLDLVLAEWGDGNPQTNGGAKPKLWLNEGDGVFVDASDQLPDVIVEFSWDLEFIDVDNDYDLDVVVSSKGSAGSFLFRNDGAGQFTDASGSMPQFTNNYEFEYADFTGDGFLDLVTINDGPSLGEHMFVNDGAGGFIDQTDPLWPASAQAPGSDDNVIAVLDVESDGDPDFAIGSLNASDRLLINDGVGNLFLNDVVIEGDNTPGTLGLQFAHLDGDGRWDMVQSQGEIGDETEKVYFGVDVPPDTAGPIITLVETFDGEQTGPVTVHARVHDNKTPVMAHDFEKVVLSVAGDEIPMQWYGGTLWRAELDGAGSVDVEVCATDAMGNAACADAITVQFPGGGDDGETGESDTSGGDELGTSTDESEESSGGDDGDDGGGGGGCDCATATTHDSGLPGALGCLALGLFGRRRRLKARATTRR